MFYSQNKERNRSDLLQSPQILWVYGKGYLESFRPDAGLCSPTVALGKKGLCINVVEIVVVFCCLTDDKTCHHCWNRLLAFHQLLCTCSQGQQPERMQIGRAS